MTISTFVSEHLVYFLMTNQWVFLNELRLVGRAVVERAIVSFSMFVRHTEDVATLALILHYSYFLFALPAQFLVCLHKAVGLPFKVLTYLYF